MKIKRLMRFYFWAGSLDEAFNNLILKTALTAGEDVYSGCLPYADKICALIETKERLGRLWFRLDGIMSAMSDRDRATLLCYAANRQATCAEEKRETHRAVVKFTRRAGGLLAGGGDLYKLMCAYQCLIRPAPD